jgi:hypothetical protein
MLPRIGAPALLGLAVLLAGCWMPPPRPSGYPTPKITPPAGMSAVEWAWFSFALPSDWKPESTGYDQKWVDGSGDTRASASVTTIMDCPSRTTPGPLATGITARADITGTGPLRVPGAGGGWRYELTGDPMGPRSQLHAWLPNCEKELWIAVFAEPGTVQRIAGTIVAQQD